MPLMCSQDGYQRLFSYSSRANSTNLSCFTDPMDSTICTDSDITTLTESEEQRLEQEYTPDSLLNEYKTERKKKLKGGV